MALPEKDGRDPASPVTFDRIEDAKLVVDHDVVVGRIAPFDLVELVLLVDVDENIAVNRGPQGEEFLDGLPGESRRFQR